MIKQKFDSSKIDESLCRFIGIFIVPCESSETVEPDERPFHNPSERLRCKSACSVRGIADFYINVEISLDIIDDLTAIAPVNKAF